MKKLIDMLNEKKLSVFLIILLFATFVLASVLIDNSQSDFDLGTYNNTLYNSSVGSGAVQLNLSYNNGTYTSQIFDTGSNVTFNNLSWEYQRIQCPEGMVYINKLNGYCIDKYEASTPGCEVVGENCASAQTNYCTACTPSSGAFGTTSGVGTTTVAYSKVNVAPLVRVSQLQARQMCANAGKYLCTSEEWLGAANLNGNYYNLPTTLSASSGYYCVVDSNTYCNYAGNSNKACNTSQYSSGTSNCVSSEGVYDMVGNVWEWTNETVSYTKPCEPVGTSGSCYWNGTNFINTTTSATAVFGNDYVYFLDNLVARSGYAVLRGGGWDVGANAGPFSAYLNSGPTVTYSIVGFRCCS